MAFGLFSKTLQRVKTATQRAFGLINRGSVTSSTGRSGVSVQSQGIEEARAGIEAIARVISSEEVPRIVAEEMASATVDEIQRSLEPISRTGALRNSIKMNPVGGAGVVVTSDKPYATAIDEGTLPVPPPEKILAWMQTKQEFSGMEHKAQRRIAFAIYYSKKKGTGAGGSGHSDIRRLPPAGEPRYSFVEQSLNNLESAFNTIGSVIRRGLTG